MIVLREKNSKESKILVWGTKLVVYITERKFNFFFTNLEVIHT